MMVNQSEYSIKKARKAKDEGSHQTTSYGLLTEQSQLENRSKSALRLMELPPMGKKRAAPLQVNDGKDLELHGLLNQATDSAFGLGGKIISGFRGIASRNKNDGSPGTMYSEVSSMGVCSFKSAFSLSGYTNAGKQQ